MKIVLILSILFISCGCPKMGWTNKEKIMVYVQEPRDSQMKLYFDLGVTYLEMIINTPPTDFNKRDSLMRLSDKAFYSADSIKAEKIKSNLYW